MLSSRQRGRPQPAQQQLPRRPPRRRPGAGRRGPDRRPSHPFGHVGGDEALCWLELRAGAWSHLDARTLPLPPCISDRGSRRAVALRWPGFRWLRPRRRPALHCGHVHRAATAARRCQLRVHARPGCCPGGRSCSRLPVPPAPASRPWRLSAWHGRRRAAPAAPGLPAGGTRQRRMPVADSTGLQRLPCCLLPAPLRQLRLSAPPRPCRTGSQRPPHWRATARPSFEFDDLIQCSSVENNPREIGKRRPTGRTVPDGAACCGAHSGANGRQKGKRPASPIRRGAATEGVRVGSAACAPPVSSRVALGSAVESAPGRPRQCQHRAAGAVAVTAVQVHGALAVLSPIAPPASSGDEVRPAPGSAAGPASLPASAWCSWSWWPKCLVPA